MKKKVLLSSIATIALCLCLIAGSTYALFTTSDETSVSVTAGKVNLTAVYDTSSMLTWSLRETEADARTDGVFANSGTAIFDGDFVVIDRMTPGDVAKFKIDVTNYSNVGIQYRVRMISVAENGVKDLTPALVTTAYVDGFNYPVTGTENATVWKYIDEGEEINDIWVTVSFPNGTAEHDNQYQEAKAKMTFIVEAVQGNADVYSITKTQADLFDANGNFANKIHNGEGDTPIFINSNAIGLAGTVTLADITLDGTSNPKAEYALIWEAGNGVDSTIILTENAKMIAAEDQDAIKVENTEPGETFTLIMDKTAKISVSGIYGHAVLAQNEGVVNLVLNGSLNELFELNNGAYAFGFAGGYYEGENITVNIFVNSEADMMAYKNAIDPDSYHYVINWFINGTPVGYTNN